MSKIAWTVIIGLIVLVVLALGATLFLPFIARNLGLGFGFGFGRFGLLGGLAWPFIILRGAGMLLFWLIIFAALFLLFRPLGQSAPVSTSVVPAESPLEILKRRYANGEINKEQYEEMRNTLGA